MRSFLKYAAVAAAFAAAEATSYTATFDQPNFKATLTVDQINPSYTTAKWTVQITEMAADFCNEEGGLKWHIHQRPIPAGETSPSGCAGTFTGGHWDPTFGCGGASEHQASMTCPLIRNKCMAPCYLTEMDECKMPSVCETLSTIPGRAEKQSCLPDTDIATCEMGDLNGKMGKISLTTTGTQVFQDPYISNLAEIEGLSIVLHCGAPRVACANLV